MMEFDDLKLYLVFSNRHEVQSIREIDIIHVLNNGLDRTYFFEQPPYDVTIDNSVDEVKFNGYSADDTKDWIWCDYFTFSKEKAEKYYEEEKTRIQNIKK